MKTLRLIFLLALTSVPAFAQQVVEATQAQTDAGTLGAPYYVSPRRLFGATGIGDVDGPASSTDRAIAIFNGTTGKIIQNSGAIVSAVSSNNVTISGADANTDLTLRGGLAGATIALGRGATGAVTITAQGTNQNITLTPSGTGFSVLGSATVTQPVRVGAVSDATTRALIAFGSTFATANYIGLSSGGSSLSIQGNPLDVLIAGTQNARFVSTRLLLGGLTTDGGGSKQLQLAGTGQINFGATANATIGVSADTTAGLLAITPPSAGAISLAGATAGTVQSLSGAGAVNVTTLTTEITSTGGAQALTLADGVAGQLKTIAHGVDGGSSVLTPTTKTGFSTITFTNAGESATLQFFATRGWMILALNGAVAAP